MKLLVGVGLVLIGFFVQTLAADNTSPRPQIWSAKIKGTINPASANYFVTAIEKANRDHAEALIVELDTPGGLVSSVRDMTQAIDQSRIPVVIYTAPAGAAATSAGALLMLGSHVAAMAPGANIGAAHPVDSSGAEIKGASNEKATNDVAAMARGLAETRGRNIDIAEQIVVKSKSLTAEEALQQSIIEILAPTFETLLKALDNRHVKVGSEMKTLHTENAVIHPIEMTLGQKVLHFLAHPNVAGLLMSLGALLIYVEMSTPGVLIPGILGGICIIVALISFELLPIRTGGLLLLIAGTVMLLLEPFIISHGALAAGGILAFALGMIWILDPSSTGLHVSLSVWLPAVISLGTVVVLIGWAAARIRRLSREALLKIGGGASAGLAGYAGVVETVEADGLHGTALFRGELWNFESAERLQPGDAVVVSNMRGMTAVVKKNPPL